MQVEDPENRLVGPLSQDAKMRLSRLLAKALPETLHLFVIQTQLIYHLPLSNSIPLQAALSSLRQVWTKELFRVKILRKTLCFEGNPTKKHYDFYPNFYRGEAALSSRMSSHLRMRTSRVLNESRPSPS